MTDKPQVGEYPYGYHVLRSIFGEAAAEDFLRVSYHVRPSGVAKNEIVERGTCHVDVV
jgi:hypothetical protein